MFLYLVQHAEAKSEQDDPLRNLTEKGVKDAEKVSTFLSKLDLQIEEIFHSGKLRAKQTAEIYARHLKVARVSEAHGLNPLDDPKVWAEKLSKKKENIMIVGHLPHLSKLASLLLVSNADIEVISFRMAGAVCLKRDNENWSVQWIVTPEILEI